MRKVEQDSNLKLKIQFDGDKVLIRMEILSKNQMPGLLNGLMDPCLYILAVKFLMFTSNPCSLISTICSSDRVQGCRARLSSRPSYPSGPTLQILRLTRK